MKQSIPSAKVKVSLSLSRKLIETIDRMSSTGSNRSQITESLLTRALRSKAKNDLDDAIVSYYEALSHDEVAEDKAMGGALLQRARKLDVDGSPAPRRGKNV